MKILIIGNGISGISAARQIRKMSDHPITVISSESDHFFSRTALMYIYMGHMKYAHTKPYEDFFWSKNKITLRRARVQGVEPSAKKLVLDKGETLAFDCLILAVGSVPKKMGWPGQNLQGVQGLYSLQDLESMEAYSAGLEQAVVVGGGLIGIEMAEMFHSRHIPVSLLVREKHYWQNILPPEEAQMIDREIRRNGIDLRLGCELQEILPDGQGRCRAVTTQQGEEIGCQFVGLTVGVQPNIAFLEGSGIDTEHGILVDELFRTNFPYIYAIGDCAQFRCPPQGRKPVEQVWYTGRMHGECAGATICGKPTPYRPSHWFNSAKFFNIEYQTYGEVPNIFPEHLKSLYWEHPNGQKSIRLVYDAATRVIVGFNLMGVRFRHEICDQWLTEGRDLPYVVAHLEDALFDPEFFEKHTADVRACYAAQFGDHDLPAHKKGKSRSWWPW